MNENYALIKSVIRKINDVLRFAFVTGIDYITRDNFLAELDNGVVLCHLAQIVQEQAKIAIAAGLAKGVSYIL